MAHDAGTPARLDSSGQTSGRNRIWPKNIELKKLGRFEFYDVARECDTTLVIATGEQRIYANILLTIGVVMPH